MMGRLSGYEEKNHGQIEQGNYPPSYELNREITLNRIISNNIPFQQSNASLPLIPISHQRSQSSQSNRSSLPSDLPPLETRAQSSFQESLRPASTREPKPISSCTTSPTFKLPPLPIVKSTNHTSNIMPPLSLAENPVSALQNYELNNNVNKADSILDMKTAYENMMMGYFMPQQKPLDCLSENITAEPMNPTSVNPNSIINFDSKTFSTQTKASHQGSQSVSDFSQDFNLLYGTLPQELYHQAQSNQLLKNQQTQMNEKDVNIPPQRSRKQIGMTHSRSSLPDSQSLYTQPQTKTLPDSMSLQVDKILKQEESSSKNTSCLSSETFFCQTDSLQNPPPANTRVLSTDIPMFIPQEDSNINPLFSTKNLRTNSSSEINPPSLNAMPISSSISGIPYLSKMDPNWGSFSVIPPVIPSATPSGNGFSDSDTISLLSYASASNNAQTVSQTGIYNSMFSPFSVNFENIPSAFNTSPRYSTRSSYSGRSRTKRALSNSPLSADGIDINAIIRMSPTSLNAYLNGSRSSSSCVSPGSNGDKTGCYGHLSARNSSSPQSGSGSSSNRRSASYTPQTGTPVSSFPNNSTSDNSNISCTNNEMIKTDFMNIDDNLLVMQAMQDLESGAGLPPLLSSFNENTLTNAQLTPEYENLQVLPQDLAAFQTEDYIPFIPSVLPPIHTHLPSQYLSSPSQSGTAVLPHTKPPPTYDQHMQRKATLQKNSSSDSSQPSNSNSSSFESSEGDKTIAGSSGTDTESNRIFACRWLDCSAIFQDQEEFVAHIEKVHIDQKKGEDYVCFWKLCPRRLHPFNARYKLLVHMRIHSGDKPNKCTYAGCNKAFSRLENLKIHLRSHTGERPYSCTFPGCTKTFSNSSDRTKHQKTHHDTKPYVCQFTGCGKRYTDPSSLRKHVKKSHPEKKEPDRKKIRSAVEELDPKDLDECLVIHSIKPVTFYDTSPPEPTDSGLGRSPRSSKPGSSSDYYPGLVYITDTQGTSSQTSPSSQHSSPPNQLDREKLPPNNNSLKVPILPSITPSPVQQQQMFPSMNSSIPCYPSNFVRATTPSTSSQSRNSFSLLQRQKLTTTEHYNSQSRMSDTFIPDTRQYSRHCS